MNAAPSTPEADLRPPPTCGQLFYGFLMLGLTAFGGALPPIMWDGILTHPASPEPVRVWLKDGPVLNLNLPAPGALDKAAPSVKPAMGEAAPAPEPAPVALPPAQARLAP